METQVANAPREGRAHRQPVKVGVRDLLRFEVTEGLQGGETIVTSGADKLTEGARVDAAAAERHRGIRHFAHRGHTNGHEFDARSARDPIQNRSTEPSGRGSSAADRPLDGSAGSSYAGAGATAQDGATAFLNPAGPVRLALRSRRPSRLKASDSTSPPWPPHSRRRRPLAASQRTGFLKIGRAHV